MSSLKSAIEIFLKYGDSDVATEQENLYASNTPPDKMSDEDVKYLKSLGWLWIETFDCWRKLI